MTRSGHPDAHTVLERINGARGELVLRRRQSDRGEVFELISNGVFLMDSAEVSTELALAHEGIAPLKDRSSLRILVGGLGLGYTLAAALQVPRVVEAVVVELEAAIVRWVSGPLGHLSGYPLRDPRVKVREEDLISYLKRTGDAFDALMIDVDNGPEFIVHPENIWLYTLEGLRCIHDRLTPGGVVTVWSSERSPLLLERMATAFAQVQELSFPLERERHRFLYYLYQGTRATEPPHPAGAPATTHTP